MTLSVKITIMVIISVMFVTCILIARYSDKKCYNDGICRHCGGKIHLFDIDSHGGRGYICPDCGYVCWISYNVDRIRKRSDTK